MTALMNVPALPFRPRLAALAVTLALAAGTGCTTYHASGATGGFSETKLSATSYQVQFRGNGYTSPARVQKFMMRRAAELALENGFRYFILDVPQNLDRHDFWAQYAERGITVRVAESPTPEAADAVVVIDDTDEAAGGRLSPKALTAFTRFKLQQAQQGAH